jgi:hypothetical protein
MRRILCIFFILFPVLAGAEPSLMFENEMHDFGSVSQGDQLEHTFDFVNTGTADLSITRLTAS